MSQQIRSRSPQFGRLLNPIDDKPRETEAERSKRQWREWLRERDEKDALDDWDDDSDLWAV